jgi:hypothetical protein
MFTKLQNVSSLRKFQNYLISSIFSFSRLFFVLYLSLCLYDSLVIILFVVFVLSLWKSVQCWLENMLKVSFPMHFFVQCGVRSTPLERHSVKNKTYSECCASYSFRLSRICWNWFSIISKKFVFFQLWIDSLYSIMFERNELRNEKNISSHLFTFNFIYCTIISPYDKEPQSA